MSEEINVTVFREGQSLLEAREYALTRGHVMGRFVVVDHFDKTETGCGCKGEDACKECAFHAASEAEMNDRQSSDFISSSYGWTEDDWESYEEELSVSLAAGVRRMLLEKYGEKLFFLKSMGADRHAARKARASTEGHGD
jgi:hypothetical protein